MIKILVTGGRDLDPDKVRTWLFQNLPAVVNERLGKTFNHFGHVEIIEGGAPGADRGAQNFAKTWGCKLTTVPADWDAYGRSAGPIRNRQMADMWPDICIEFPGGNGTANMVNLCLARRIPLHKAEGYFR